MSTPPKIALMLPRFSHYGGVEQFGYRLSEALAQEGYAVDFICARQEAQAPEGVHVISVGRPGGFKVFKMLWFLLRAERLRKQGKYDLTISLGKTWNQDITRIGGGPLQAFWRLSDDAWPAGYRRTLKKIARRMDPSNWLTLYIENRMFHQSPCIIAISGRLRGWVEEVYPHLESCAGEHAGKEQQQRLYTVYNCPDVSRFRPPSAAERAAAREQFACSPGEYSLGIATTNFALKGVGPLIRALTLLPNDCHLHIAGGRNAAPYKALAQKCGVDGRVHFHGRVAEMQQFYHALDMFVLPSFYDTLGNVVLEALGSGLKTLCSGNAGAADFLPQEQVLQNPGDPQEIAAKVALLRKKSAPVAFEPKGTGIAEIVALVKEELARKHQNGAHEGSEA